MSRRSWMSTRRLLVKAPAFPRFACLAVADHTDAATGRSVRGGSCWSLEKWEACDRYDVQGRHPSPPPLNTLYTENGLRHGRVLYASNALLLAADLCSSHSRRAGCANGLQGETFANRALVLATGSTAVLPPVPPCAKLVQQRRHTTLVTERPLPCCIVSHGWSPCRMALKPLVITMLTKPRCLLVEV
jgi:hypothetical protein